MCGLSLPAQGPGAECSRLNLRLRPGSCSASCPKPLQPSPDPLMIRSRSRMAEAPQFRTTMEFAYGVPRELAPGVVRLVANNPSPFTFKGTNTYLVGSGSGEVALIDPGPEDAAHREAILAAIGGRRLSHILITHTHHDHVEGLAALVAATGAKTAGFGRRSGAPGTRRTSLMGSEHV